MFCNFESHRRNSYPKTLQKDHLIKYYNLTSEEFEVFEKEYQEITTKKVPKVMPITVRGEGFQLGIDPVTKTYEWQNEFKRPTHDVESFLYLTGWRNEPPMTSEPSMTQEELYRIIYSLPLPSSKLVRITSCECNGIEVLPEFKTVGDAMSYLGIKDENSPFLRYEHPDSCYMMSFPSELMGDIICHHRKRCHKVEKRCRKIEKELDRYAQDDYWVVSYGL